MLRKVICLVSFVLMLSLAGNASAALPAGWADQDIGTTGGSANEAGGTWTVSGDGVDIWGTSDGFHYAYVPLAGDGQIVARVVSNGTGSNNWAKGGVMIRETLDPGSKHAMIVVTGSDGSGMGFQWRPTTGSSSSSVHDQAPAVAPPHWVKIVREGNDFSGFRSLDGLTWTQQGTTTTIDMVPDVYIGLCVTSHASGEVRTFTFDNVSTELPKVALSPTPKDGALYPETWVSLSWAPGSTAATHDVYFGESFADVNDGTGDTFRGNQPSTFYVVGFPGFPYPDGLVPGTTYYWRIDEVEADGVTVHKGKVWSFFIPPKKAYDPSPPDGAAFIVVDTVLTWQPGFGTKLHTVYFGDDLDTVANAAGGIPQALAQYNPGTLEFNKTYYWRVDEFDAVTTNKGDAWSFTTTLPGLGSAVMDRWENITGTNLDALKNSPKYPNGPDVTETVDQFLWDGPDISDYGARIEGWLYVPATGEFTFWLATDDQGELWLSTDDDSSNIELIANVPGWTNLNEWTKYASQKSQPIMLTGGEKYYIMALWKEGGGGDHCHVAWEGPGIAARTTIPGTNLAPFEPMSAYGAKPSNRATGVTQTPILQWKPGLQAASHEVYLGTDEDAVGNATKSSPEYKGSKALGDESYDPGKLAWETTYYWRVDEINTGNPASPWVGSVWSFTTADFLIVDDFEDYTDDDAANEAIWQSWIDGFGVPANGSQVGYVMPPYAEQTVVHSGRQSMPLLYDNTAGVKLSEAELKLATVRNWTEEGVANLSIWFHALPGSTGSFVEAPAGTYTMTGSGTDIWNNGTAGDYHDEFHFAYKTLTGAGSIVAKVESVQNTNGWAKAGVMIRETLEPGSRHAFGCVTPANGVASQGRIDTSGDSFNTAQAGTTAPHWVKLERDLSGNFTVSHSANGTTWQPVTGATPQNIQMGSTVYVGLAVTSHDAALTCQAVFSNVTITGTVSPQWAHQDIGIASNAAEPLYVAVSNSAGQPAVVVHDDPAAAQIDAWTQWIIPLSAFADQGINLTNVDRIAIGLGARGNMTASGGSGTVYFDDIQLTRPAPEPEPQP
ncbi:MAG: hypothetical protein ABIF19_03420 [Planctomycetota bacterium]